MAEPRDSDVNYDGEDYPDGGEDTSPVRSGTSLEVSQDPVTGHMIPPGKFDPKEQLAIFEAQAELMQKLVPTSVKVTKPQDWIEMGKHVYLQLTGVERLTGLWGLVFDRPEVERENHPDGSFTYIVRGGIGSRRTGVYYRSIEGGRWSGDPFFARYPRYPEGWGKMSRADQDKWKEQNRIPPNPLDVRKAALANWMCRGASMLCGLRNLTRADVEPLVGKIQSVQFGEGTKGGKAKKTDDSGVAVVPFGRNEGTPVTQLTNNQLNWYTKKAKEALDDPAKERFHAKEQAWLKALNDERARRLEGELDSDGPGDEG